MLALLPAIARFASDGGTGGTLRARPYAKAVLRQIALKIKANVLGRLRSIFPLCPLPSLARRSSVLGTKTAPRIERRLLLRSASTGDALTVRRRLRLLSITANAPCAPPQYYAECGPSCVVPSAPLLRLPRRLRRGGTSRRIRLATSRPLTLLTPHAPPIVGCCGALLRYALSRRLRKAGQAACHRSASAVFGLRPHLNAVAMPCVLRASAPETRHRNCSYRRSVTQRLVWPTRRADRLRRTARLASSQGPVPLRGMRALRRFAACYAVPPDQL